MHHLTVCSTALPLAMLCALPAAAQGLQTPCRPGAVTMSAVMPCHASAADAHTEHGIVLAQGKMRVPSDADLERMQERAIATPPIDTGAAGGKRADEETEIRQMDQRARRIDQDLMNSGAICRDCK